MKNADMPAYPSMLKAGDVEKSESGLTKREYFAAAMNHEASALTFDTKESLSTFLCRDVDITDFDDLTKAVVQVEAKIRVMRADALLAELERTK